MKLWIDEDLYPSLVDVAHRRGLDESNGHVEKFGRARPLQPAPVRRARTLAPMPEAPSVKLYGSVAEIRKANWDAGHRQRDL